LSHQLFTFTAEMMPAGTPMSSEMSVRGETQGERVGQPLEVELGDREPIVEGLAELTLGRRSA